MFSASWSLHSAQNLQPIELYIPKSFFLVAVGGELSKTPKELIFQLSLETGFQLISTTIRFVTPGFHTSLSAPSHCRCHRVPKLDPPAPYTPHQVVLHASARRRSLHLRPSRSGRRCTKANSPHHEAEGD